MPRAERAPVRPGALLLLASLLLASCASQKREVEPEPPAPRASDRGGFYGGDGVPESVPVAVPRDEPPSRSGNRPYEALGKRYRPLPPSSARSFVQRGKASWYGKKFHGRRTSSGEPYDMFTMTAAHPTLPLPSYVEVTNLDNGRRVVVKVNDRGPFLRGRIIDLSYAAAVRLGYLDKGTANVEIRTVYEEEPAAQRETAATGSAFSGTAGSAGGVYIQVGAFSDPVNARELGNRLRAEGFAPVEVRRDGAGRALHRVRVGPFASTLEADRKLAALDRMLDTRPHLVYDR